MNSLRLRFDNFLHSSNRKNGTKNFLVSLTIIFLSLFIALFICMIIYGKASLFTDVFYQIFTAPFTKSNVGSLFTNISIFVVAACSFIFAFKCGLFNIGISGQMLFAGMFATIIGQYMKSVPNVIGQIILIIVAMCMGGLIAAIIGWLKAKFNMNEVVSSIMFNWIIYFAGTYMVKSLCNIDPSGTYTESLTDNVLLQINGQSAVPLIILSIFAVIFCFVIFKFLVFGKKITDVGLSLEGSRYAGYSVKKNQILSMLISGLIAGLLGAMVYLGKSNGNVPTEITAKAIPIEGFNGISVGLIAMNNPIGIVPVSILFGMIETAKSSIAQSCGVDAYITDLMFGIIVYGAAVVSLLYYIKPWRWIMKLCFKNKNMSYEEYTFNVESQINEYTDAISLIKKKYWNNIFKRKPVWYYKNKILLKLKIQNTDVKTWKQKKMLLNKIYSSYSKCRITKGGN